MMAGEIGYNDLNFRVNWEIDKDNKISTINDFEGTGRTTDSLTGRFGGSTFEAYLR